MKKLVILISAVIFTTAHICASDGEKTSEGEEIADLFSESTRSSESFSPTEYSNTPPQSHPKGRKIYGNEGNELLFSMLKLTVSASRDAHGSSFLWQEDGVPYVVTNKHVAADLPAKEVETGFEEKKRNGFKIYGDTDYPYDNVRGFALFQVSAGDSVHFGLCDSRNIEKQERGTFFKNR